MTWRLKDVKGDGSCFFRSIFHSARHGKILPAVLKRLNIKDKPDEEGFVRQVRDTLAYMVLQREDRGIMTNIFEHLKELSSADYKQVITSSFPAWFVAAFRKLPKTENVFRDKFAEGVRKVTSWASEIEVRLLKLAIERDGKYELVILNTPPTSTTRFKKRGVYVLNLGEAHYNAVLISTSKAKVTKECKQDQIYNEKTRRCVSRKSCKGYELLVKHYEKLLKG